MRKRKYQVETFTIANTTAAGVTAEIQKKLDIGFERCVGIGLSDAGSSNKYLVGVKVQNDWVVDPIPQEALEINAAQNADARFLPVNFEAKGNTVTILNKTLAEITGDTVVQMIFVLENE